MGKIADLFIKLGLKKDEFDKGITEAKNQTTSFGSVIKNLGGMIAGAFAVSSIISFGKEIFAMANESIKVENELGAAIKANGKDVEATIKQYKLFANEMINISTVDDEVTFGMLRLAETLQSNAPMEAVKNALALSKALGVDLQTAVKMAVLAQSDMYSMLQRYVPSLREAGTEAERAAEYHKLLASGQQMLNDEMNTTAGKIIQNQNLWNNLKETWGTAISESKILSWALKLVNDDLTIATSELPWYEKAWYRLTLQHKKGAEAARELAEANKAAAKSAPQTTPTVLGEVTVTGDKDYKENNRIKLINARAAAEKKATEELQKQADLIEYINSITSGVDIASAGLMTGKEAGSVSGVDTKSLSGFNENGLTALAQKNSDIAKSIQADWDNFAVSLNNTINDNIIGSIEVFAESLGQLAAGEINLRGFFANILGQFSTFLGQMGKLLIAFGVGQLAFGNALKNIFNPEMAIPLIAAGAAMVALSGAIGGLARKAGSSGSSGVSSNGSMANMAGITSQQNQTLVAKVSGRDLALVLERNKTYRTRT